MIDQASRLLIFGMSAWPNSRGRSKLRKEANATMKTPQSMPFSWRIYSTRRNFLVGVMESNLKTEKFTSTILANFSHRATCVHQHNLGYK